MYKMNFINFIFMGLLLFKKDSHAATNEANTMDRLERTLDALESRLTSMSGRLSTVEDKLDRLMDTVGNLEQCKACVTSVEVTEQQPTCQVYEGSVCSKHTGNTSIYNTTRHDIGLKEERLVAALSVISNSRVMSDQCMKYFIPSVCHFAFPQCDRDSKSAVRRMCRDECEMLESTICMNEYKLASSCPVLPRCDQLPHDGKDCIRIGLPVKSSDDFVTSVDVTEQQPTCQVYDGSVCSKHIGNRSIYNTTRHNMGLKEERLVAALSVISNSRVMSNQCMEYFIPSVCHFAFPQCDQDSKSTVRRMCRDECEMLESTICMNEYKLASHNQVVGPVLPRCDQLPLDGKDCIRIGLPVKSSDDFVTSVNVTEQQPTCQVYDGSVCSKHIGNRSIYNITRHNMGLKEERLVAALSVISNSRVMSDQCMKYFIPSVCHFAFPQCDQDSKSAVRRMCRDECEMLESTICMNEYKHTSRHLDVGPVLPRCDQLPHDGTDCIRIGLPFKSTKDENPVLPVLTVREVLAQVVSPHSVHVTWVDADLNRKQEVRDDRYYTIRYTPLPKQQKYSKVRAKTNVVNIDELQADTTYQFSVRVTRDGFKSQWSTPVRNTTLKTSSVGWSAPRNVRVSVKDSQFVLVEWDEPETIYRDIEGYKVFFTHQPERPISLWQHEVIRDKQTSIIVSPERPGTKNYFSVMALSSAFGQSPMSELVELNPNEAGSYPLNLTVRSLHDDVGSVILTWKPPQPSRPISVYVVLYTTDPSLNDTEWIAEGVKSDKLSLTIEDLTPGETYSFKIKTFDVLTVGKKYGPNSPIIKHVVAKHLVPGSGPRNVRARVKDSQFIIVEWEAPEFPNGIIVGYKVFFTHQQDLPVIMWQHEYTTGSMKAIVSPEKPESTNYFIVRAFNAYGLGPMSEVVKLTPKNEDSYPMNLTVRAIHDDPTSVYVTWQPSETSRPITVYIVFYTTDPSQDDRDRDFKAVEGDTFSLTIKHLTLGETYYFKIRSMTGDKVYGPVSPSVMYDLTERNFPGSPRNVRVTAPDQYSITIEWDEPEMSNGVIQGYQVRLISRSRGPMFNSQTEEVKGDSRTLTVSNLQPNTTYYVSVSAVSDVGVGPMSENVKAVTKDEAPQTYPPNLVVVGVDNEPGTVIVIWEPPESVIPIYEYLIYYTTDSSRLFGYWLTSIVKGDVLSTRIRDLRPDETYSFTIKAVNAKGIGPMSPAVIYENP